MLNVCISCTTAFSVGATECPNCGSPDFIDEGAEFPRPEPEPESAPKVKRTKAD